MTIISSITYSKRYCSSHRRQSYTPCRISNITAVKQMIDGISRSPSPRFRIFAGSDDAPGRDRENFMDQTENNTSYSRQATAISVPGMISLREEVMNSVHASRAARTGIRNFSMRTTVFQK